MNGPSQPLYPDFDRWQEMIPCQGACPVHTDARGYVTAIAEGDLERAYLIAREPNPFASICGRVCAAPCEAACRRGKIDAAVAIRALKRFVTERYGAEADPERSIASLPPGWPIPLMNGTPWDRRHLRALGVGRSKRRVAVVGSGVAGLTCAHDLALLGYRVTVFEKQNVAGGMLVLGVPEYRLPRKVVQAEIGAVLSLGVELCLGKALGRDFSLSDLRENFDAVFLAIGATQGRDLAMEGVQLDGVFRAVEYLLNVHLGFQVELGERVMVIGGGDVAMDAARMALRQEVLPTRERREPALASDMYETMDAAREALRRGAKEVHIFCLESWEEMPAQRFEIEEALKEGIVIHPRLGPKRILGEHGTVTGLETQAVASVFDEDGRFNPRFYPDTEQIHATDSVILAVGQMPDLRCLRPEDGVSITPGGTIEVDRRTLATTAPGVFAGGDAAFGPRIFIEGVENGHRASRSIHEYLAGQEFRPLRRGRWSRLDPFPAYRGEPGTEPGELPSAWLRQFPRQEPPALPVGRRIGIAEVELTYPPAIASQQGERCLRCSVHPIHNGSLCILCGGCVDVCPERCFRMVSLDRLTNAEKVELLEGAGELQGEGEATVMRVDTERCIRCGLCAVRCPTGAITMERFDFAEEWSHPAT